MRRRTAVGCGARANYRGERVEMCCKPVASDRDDEQPGVARAYKAPLDEPFSLSFARAVPDSSSLLFSSHAFLNKFSALYMSELDQLRQEAEQLKNQIRVRSGSGPIYYIINGTGRTLVIE